MQERKACCFTGHRPNHLPWGLNEQHILCRKTREAIALCIEYAYQDGFRLFYTGMAQGIDLVAAETVLHCKKLHPDIELAAAIPYAGHARSWSGDELERYCSILSQCREGNIHILAPAYARWCLITRDRYMVDHSQRLIAVYDGKSSGGTQYTLSYAMQQKIETVIIDPNRPMLPRR